jgi:hypothetical protein
MSDLDLDALRRLHAASTQGEWVVQDGCSWRRIGAHGDGDVLCPTTARDGHPDLDGRNRDADLAFIVAAHAAVPGLIERVESHELALRGIVELLLDEEDCTRDLRSMVAEIRRAWPETTVAQIADAVRSCTAWGHPRGEVERKDAEAQGATVDAHRPMTLNTLCGVARRYMDFCADFAPMGDTDEAKIRVIAKVLDEMNRTREREPDPDEARWLYSWSCGDDDWHGGRTTKEEAVKDGLRARDPADGTTFFVAHMKRLALSEHDLEGREVWNGKPPNWEGS